MHVNARSHEHSCSHDERAEQGVARLNSEIAMLFLDDIPMKGYAVEEKDESMNDPRGCRKFVTDHIRDCEKVLES